MTMIPSSLRLSAALAALTFLPQLQAADTSSPAAPIPPVSFTPSWSPADGANHPLGVGQGIHPGRVTWIRNLAATPWDGEKGNWWDEGTGISQATVCSMFSRSIRALVTESSDAKAWKAIFEDFNHRHHYVKTGYKPGQKLVVKINCNNAYEGYGDGDGQIDQSPQTVHAVLKQLVKEAGVPPEMITVLEATRVIPDRVFKPSHAEFPGVRFEDSKGDGTNGRFPVEYVTDTLHYSIAEPRVGKDLPKCVVEATYIVNLTLVKGHPTTGVTLTAKNHYGTVNVRDHSEYVNSHAHPMGRYHPFVDMIGSKALGAKTVLFVLDGLYGIRDVNDNVSEHAHWNKLFHGEWLASLFMSQDPLAIDSVGFDFLRAEFPMGRFKDFEPTKNADNYMHEGALAEKAPSGIRYAPDGEPLKSLGVHEHWNNPADKHYSRNLDPKHGKGIELLIVPPR